MLLYILKFSACLAVLLLFYKLFLERENMHVFKRFYLLGALAFSLIVPQLVFTEYVAVEPVPQVVMEPTTDTVVQPIVQSTDVIGVPPALETDIVDIAPLLWGIYFLGLIFFGLNFIKNLVQVYQRIKKNPKERKDPFVRVLLRETFPPHTFFNYIFLNKVKLESNKIPQEVLLHEETHAKQKHSLDVLFIELLQVAMWFNPLVYFARKSIKLNHEFLADSEVLKKGMDSSTYQNTLLSFMVPKNQNQPLANAINYSSIKKRFTVMKTQTSKKAVLFRSSLILPLLTLLVMGFSKSRTVEILEDDPFAKEYFYAEDIIEIFIDGTGQLSVMNEVVSIADLPSYLLQFNTHLAKTERETKVRAKIFPDETISKKTISEIESILLAYGVAQIDILGPEFPTIQKGATPKQLSKYNTLAKKYNAQPKEKRVIPSGDLKSLEGIYRKMSKKQKTNAQPFPECLPKNKQDSTSSKLMEEYNELASSQSHTARSIHIKILDDGLYLVDNLKATKKTLVPVVNQLHNDITPGIRNNIMNIHLSSLNPISKEEVWFIYNSLFDYGFYRLVAKEQEVVRGKGNTPLKTDAMIEKQSASREQIAEYNALAKKYNVMLADDNYIRIKKTEVNRLEYLHSLMTEEQRENAEPFPDFPEPPEPPTPPSPEDPMAKEFVDEAIEYIIAHQDPHDRPGGGMVRKITEVGNPQEILEIHPNVNSYFDAEDRDNTIYHNGKKISYLEMMRMQKDGEIKSINVFKNAVGQKVISITGFNEQSNETESNVSVPPAPPAPPKPKAPLDYVIEMAKKDARFYFEGKEISSDKAIKLMKTNKNLNIDSRRDKGKRPIVKLSKEGFKIGDASNAKKKSYDIQTSKSDQRVALVSMRSNIQKERNETGERILLNRDRNTENKGQFKVFINGSPEKKLVLEKTEIKNLKLTMEKGRISSFKFKIPGSPTQHISGGQLYPNVKEMVDLTSSGMIIQLFALKSDIANFDYSPIVIKVK